MSCNDAQYWSLVANLSLGLGYACLGFGVIWRFHRWTKIANDYETICTQLLDDNTMLAQKLNKAATERDAWQAKAEGQ